MARRSRCPPQRPGNPRDAAFADRGGLQAPDLHPGGVSASNPRSTLACLQVRSRDMSIEEWKGSETYSPNTAYGKSPALACLPASGHPQMPAHTLWPGSLSPIFFPWFFCSCLEGGEQMGPWGGRHLAGSRATCVDLLSALRRGLPGARDGLRLPHLPQVLPQQLGRTALPLQVLGPL